MPLNRYVVRVDPQGQTVTVDVLDTTGVSVVAYESSQFAAATVTLPLMITTPTDFWLHDPGPYDVSCKVGGAEVADAGAPKRVQVSDVPALVVPDWVRERTSASSGGSVALALPKLGSSAQSNSYGASPYAGLFTADVQRPHIATITSVVDLAAGVAWQHGAHLVFDGTVPTVDAGLIATLGALDDLGVHYSSLQVDAVDGSVSAIYRVSSAARVPIPTDGDLTFTHTTSDGSSGDLALTGGGLSITSTAGGRFIVRLMLQIDLWWG